jgi:glycosyltransferase involved in cell wall biosynthesis
VKILLVAMVDSIHTARWIEQIADQGWDIHIFPSVVTYKVHPQLKNITIYRPDGRKLVIKEHGLTNNRVAQEVKVNSIKLQRKDGLLGRLANLFFKASPVFKELLVTLFSRFGVSQLNRIIRKVQPDIIHSLEFQHAGYLTLKVKNQYTGKFPTWITTNWGSDIYLFGRLAKHEVKIREVLAECDFYSCECHRDVKLAREFGFTGQVLPVFPNAGGFDFSNIEKLQQPGPASARRKIMLKGYQGWAGRALVGLRALERCLDVLEEYEIVIHSAKCDEVMIATELFTKKTGIKVTIVDPGQPHQEILRLHGQSRISIGLSISDGISTSFLEALVMGSFPIQSFTACADEWIEDGKTGILVHPDDPDNVEKAIRRALTEDFLIDKAAELNYETARNRLDQSSLKIKVINLYKKAVKIGNLD